MPIEDVARNALVAVVGIYAVLKTVEVLFEVAIPIV